MGRNVLAYYVGIKRAEIQPGLNTRRVHLFFENLTSPRRSEPGAISNARRRLWPSRRPRRRLRGNSGMWVSRLAPPTAQAALANRRTRHDDN